MKRPALYVLLFILLLPLMFIAPHEEEPLLCYLFKLALPLSIVGVFWANYRWFVPDYLHTHRLLRLLRLNAAVILSCVVMLSMVHIIESKSVHRRHEASSQTFPPPPKSEKPFRPRREEKFDYFAIFLGMRDGLYLLLGFFMAYVILSKRRVDRLQQEKQEAETARQTAELCALRNQVSPHFLLNTLNGIYALSLVGDERTSDAIIRLSHLLRHTLYASRDEFVRLSSEADFVRAYTELMTLRLTDNVSISTHISISPDSPTEIAPFIILSLLENAFKHGTDADHPCHVDIRMSEDEDSILVCMRNSNRPKGQNDNSGHGIGMQLVRKRLEYAYPKAYTWTYGVQGDEWVTELIINKAPTT
ncbi:MAG: histidine kinase [Bacteroidales bacterium]|nr:histidine kinase [Candidatus Physcousia equi]